MRKIIVKCLTIGLLVSLLTLSLVGCGASKMAYDSSAGTSITEESVSVNTSVKQEALEDVDLENSSTKNQVPGRKIIENVALSVETKEFDALLKSIDEQIVSMGGYVESSDIYGREMDSEDNRSADMVIRIPAEKSKEFSNYISENSVIVNRSVTTQDVTLEYVDMESRVTALQAEKEALEQLLKNADKVEDIISVRDKLTEVIYEIESYESQLRTYDNLVSYSTVSISIWEVERTTVVEEQNTWQKIGTNLKNNFADVWDGVVAVFVFLVSAIPYLIPFVVIAAVVLLIIFRKKKKMKKL